MSESQVHEKELIPADARELLSGALTYWQEVKEVTVKTDAEYEAAIEVCKNIKRHTSDLEAKRKELVKPFKDKASKIDAEFREVRVPLENGEKQLKQAASRYYAEQERKRIEAQRKAEAEAEEKRRKEEERARREREKAAEYEAKGREDLAEKAQARADAAEDRADTIVSDAPATTTQKPAGVSYREVYKVTRIDDRIKAIAYCQSNPFLLDCIDLNTAALEKIMNTMKRKLDIPGLTIVKDYTTAIRK